jgi:integrase/recombinase XerC
MVLDSLLTAKNAVRIRALDSLLISDPLYDELQNYLLACRVEGKSPKTLDGYITWLCGLSKTLKALDVQNIKQVNEKHLRLHMLSLIERGLAPSTQHDHYRSIKTFFNWLVREGTIDRSPMDRLRGPRQEQKIVMPYSKDEISGILTLCDGNRFTEIRNRAMVLILLDTGLRLAELANIQIADMDLKAETIKVMGKGRKERRVRISSHVQRAVLKYAALRQKRGLESPALWVSEEGSPMVPDGVQCTLVKLVRRAGVKTGSVHKFRHTFAIMFLRNGGSEFNLQYILGHTTLLMTQKYVRSLGWDDAFRSHEGSSPVGHLLGKFLEK